MEINRDIPLHGARANQQVHARRTAARGESSSRVEDSSTVVNLSERARQMAAAQQELDKAEAVRPGVVARGEALIRNWSGISDAQADHIMMGMLGEFSA